MITNKIIYELSQKELTEKIEIVSKEISNLLKVQNKLVEWFKYRDILVDGTALPIKVEIEIQNIKLYNVQATHYNNVIVTLKSKEEYRTRLLGYKIPKKIFLFILRRFNQLLYQELIHNAYVFKDATLGKLLVIVNKNKKNAINWGESTKNKKVLLDKGEIPFTKEGEDLAKAKGEEYKGKQWLEYLPTYSLFFNWELENSNFIRLPNMKNFEFRPIRGLPKTGVTSPVNLLSETRKELTDQELLTKYKVVC